MKSITILAFFAVLLNTGLLAQQITQTVRGTVIDLDSKNPLIGVEVILDGSNPFKGTVTNEQGVFKLKEVPVGRIILAFSYLGYENLILSNVTVNSGKEVILNVSMQESIVNFEEVVVTAQKNKGEAINEMALLSARSISTEESTRFAIGFNDPGKVASNFAGVTNTQDGSNDLIIRGNAPKYVQWRLEGVQITNPNHFADPNAASGSISSLNNNILATSDFYSGAFAPEFGDVLSGVFDVKLRPGNNEKFEGMFSAGLLGIEAMAEGPLSKNYGGSYLFNYRYSTVGLITDLGLIDVGGVPTFQDGAFKIVLPTKKIGSFSLFGLAGKSNLTFKDVTPSLWVTPGNNSYQNNIKEDFLKQAHLVNLGVNHILSVSDNSYFKSTIAYSNEGIKDQVIEKNVLFINDNDGQFLKDSVLSTKPNYLGDLTKSVIRTAFTYHLKINAKHKFQLGLKTASFNLNNQQSQLNPVDQERIPLIDFDERINTLRTFFSWKYRLNEKISIVSGLHNMNVLYNNKSTLEPRIAIRTKLNNFNSFYAGYGLHSNMESIQHYFSKIQQTNGTISEPNRDLDLLKAHHFVVGYEKKFGKNNRLSIEAYYQNLYNLPVENNDTSYFATINEGLDFQYLDLVNEGTGKNYGFEITFEHFFSNNFYFLINGSLFQSKYKSLEGIERNTQYNSEYLFNFLAGKEFTDLGRKENQVLGINAKFFFGGGRKIIPLLRNEDGSLAVDSAQNQFWNYEKAYENKIEDLYSLNISASYKWNRSKTTHELFLNIENITNTKGKITEFYDIQEPNSIGYRTQFGLFANLMYRFYF